MSKEIFPSSDIFSDFFLRRLEYLWDKYIICLLRVTPRELVFFQAIVKGGVSLGFPLFCLCRNWKIEEEKAIFSLLETGKLVVYIPAYVFEVI